MTKEQIVYRIGWARQCIAESLIYRSLSKNVEYNKGAAVAFMLVDGVSFDDAEAIIQSDIDMIALGM